ncbi:MAG TPA: hypothetical protein VFI31_01875 [Pirellulales bacterium]|nr:hypothetical protein [Pirellulales bacterium]
MRGKEAQLAAEAPGPLSEATGNRDELAVFFKEQEVWRVDRGTYGERDKPYFLMGLSESPPAQ